MRCYHLKGQSATDKVFKESPLFIGVEIFNKYNILIFFKYKKNIWDVTTSKVSQQLTKFAQNLLYL